MESFIFSNIQRPIKLKSPVKHFSLLLFISLNPIFAQAQDGISSLWEHYTVKNDSLGEIKIHVTKHTGNEKKPLLVFLEGSGNYPLFYQTNNGRYGTGVTLTAGDYAGDYHVVLISKPGVPFSDSLRYSSSGRPYYPGNSNYNELYSLDWRARAAALAIDFLIDRIPVDTSGVIVMGHSEGAQVAPAVAVLNPKVTHIVAMMGNALNHLYDFLIEARLRVENGLISPTEGQEIADSLFLEYEKIYRNPASTSDYWFGETYYKWSSFTLQTPLENMLKLDIPILYIAGGKDNNQTIITMDYAKLEFLRKGKHNLTYKVYPDYDHYFQEQHIQNGETTWIDHIDEVHRFAIEWTKQTDNKKPSDKTQ